MTKWDYVALADVLAVHVKRDARQGGIHMAELAELTDDIADVLARDNGRFDRTRFMVACGLDVIAYSPSLGARAVAKPDVRLLTVRPKTGHGPDRYGFHCMDCGYVSGTTLRRELAETFMARHECNRD